MNMKLEIGSDNFLESRFEIGHDQNPPVPTQREIKLRNKNLLGKKIVKHVNYIFLK